MIPRQSASAYRDIVSDAIMRQARGGLLTLAAAKMSLTDSAISGPIPSPSIKLTRKLP